MLDELLSNDSGTFTKRVRFRPNRALQENQWWGGVMHTHAYRLSSRTKLPSTVMNEESTKKLQWTSQLQPYYVYQNRHTLGIVGVVPRSAEDSDG